MGRITALRKEDGGVRGITVVDILRRLVARTIAQQISKVVEESTVPYQYALSTKVGCECVAHIVQTLTVWTALGRSISYHATPCWKG